MQNDALPFVETTVARHIQSRLTMTHEECAITIISGPYGLGKTTAIDAFQRDYLDNCIIVKAESGAKRGATPIIVAQLVANAICELVYDVGSRTEKSVFALKNVINAAFDKWKFMRDLHSGKNLDNRFTIIFDEAQFLSRDAIEMLRFWNDLDRTATPFPIGLAFIGNNEFALQEDRNGESAISGAVRSRALFVEKLDYLSVTDTDLTLFAQSRGIDDSAAIATFIRYFSKPRVSRDLRQAERFINIFLRRANGEPVTVDLVNSVLNP